MSQKKIVTIDYGMGNLWSVQSAVRYLGRQSLLSSDPDQVREANFLILPGVGSFRKAMETLRRTRLEQAILEAVKVRGAKILGICLGMQLLGASGSEDGKTKGLGLISNAVDKFSPQELNRNKIPHVGFNTVHFAKCSGLFRSLPPAADFYFVHSYRMLGAELKGNWGTCNYGTEFLAAFEVNNICGTQFHPEKSQTNGLILLGNFLEI
ncbi:MAG: imidazole glycerol phosphate synthase subunit HisH [Candidatus Omnitrophica bacterium]|nr:imidazole glycerol phosphate synthase subunit HisH [Candidatus Omnitrophota bacterium]